MVEAEFVEHVKGLGDIYGCASRADAQLLALREKGIERFVLPSEVVKMRFAGISEWTSTCVAPVIIKGERTILMRYSPLMDPRLMHKAVLAHSKGQYPDFFSAEVYEEAREKAKAQEGLALELRDYFVLPSKEDFKVAPDSKTAKFLGFTSEYFSKFNGGRPIDFVNLPNNVRKGKSRVNFLWISRAENGSYLETSGQYLSLNFWSYGVKNE